MDQFERLRELSKLYLEEPGDFKPGDLVEYKPGLRNTRRPRYNEAAIVLEIQPGQLDPEHEAGSPYYKAPSDMRISVLNGRKILCYWVDRRRFRPAVERPELTPQIKKKKLQADRQPESPPAMRPDEAGRRSKPAFNPALMNTDVDLESLTRQLLAGGMTGFSLCLFGATGTGKSDFARYLAGKMKLEVLHKRASDLIDRYSGETEKAIAAAFQEARSKKKFLIFDEADSFLLDRRQAHHFWEVREVNEMLTWMEDHPYPFACTTNFMDRLDPASLRRFTFKVKFDYLTIDQARLAFSHFFGQDFELKLEALTPGDFAVVARRAAIMGLTDPAELIEMLAREQEAKGIKSTVMGFGTC
jgi:hypothetical protein